MKVSKMTTLDIVHEALCPTCDRSLWCTGHAHDVARVTECPRCKRVLVWVKYDNFCMIECGIVVDVDRVISVLGQKNVHIVSRDTLFRIRDRVAGHMLCSRCEALVEASSRDFFRR